MNSSEATQSPAKVGFSSLPSELIVRILSYLTNPHDILHAGLTAREIQHCTLENSVWASALRSRWKYSKNKQITDTNWREEYKRRDEVDTSIDRQVEGLIHTVNNARIPSYRYIRYYDLDMKDRLLHHIHCPDDVEDVLARRYWAQSMLKAHYRFKAVQTWQDISSGKDVSLEKALSAFEMFFRDDDDDQDSISEWLDDMAAEFMLWKADYLPLDTRNRALLLAQFMIAYKDFDSRGSEQSYYDIRNNFIGLTLQDPARAGLPIIYVAIFCALAQRIGLDAHPCSFPFHVYAIVTAPEGFDLSGKARSKHNEGVNTRMFLDLYGRTTLEVSESDLRLQMEHIPEIPLSLHDQYLGAADPAAMVIRVRQNLMNAIQRAHESDAGAMTPNGQFLNYHMEELLYAVVWLTLVFDGPDVADVERRRSHLSFLMRPLETTFFADWYLFQTVVMPTFEGTPAAPVLRQHMLEMRKKDLEVPLPKYRSSAAEEDPDFKIGTCFIHRKYHYCGIIIGWDTSCTAPDAWQEAHQIGALEFDSRQSFYNVVSADGTSRYVAQENIGPTPMTGPPEAIMRMAGKYFLRWEDSSQRFVSNLKAHYPDD